MGTKFSKTNTEKLIKDIDEKYSGRNIALDPNGYFLIIVDEKTKELVVKHFSNNIDDTGRATDPTTGKVISCSNGNERYPVQIFKGKTAKELGIKITEGEGPLPLSKLDHALYLGRELQKAEYCLIHGKPYIQD
ncbi:MULTISPECIES: DUF4346 domain-containing protein [unclassified Prochlorococcus]|uniref:DUF4346 domain-containing protein n=1 Tax=unclassified Prochlorococcus TaxID=2627481 RepID=UPI0005337C4D|nr:MULTISPECIES: DUF4346 domain-containing protein [unclassified Prochlorococcus]KGG16835.1 Pterin-binding family [Prochlorococcus sp. MIT 0602]KGG18191.1 Pterin-binding family [Prochlorococcus sp. MIT 0603]